MRRFLLVVALLLLTSVLASRSSLAQNSGTGPSGGTGSAYQSRTEVTSPAYTLIPITLRTFDTRPSFSRRTLTLLFSRPMLAVLWRRGLL